MIEIVKQHETIAIFGVGTMGRGMALSALRANIPTVLWDPNPEHSSDLADLGAQIAGTAVDAAISGAIAITIVDDEEAVMSIASNHGMLDVLPENAIWIQMGTIGVRGIDRVRDLVNKRRPDVTLLDAPVSGTKECAELGELRIFASGPDSARTRVESLFDVLGKRTVWMGPTGEGSRIKLVNDTFLAFEAEGIASAIALARTLGLDTSSVMEALDYQTTGSFWRRARLQQDVDPARYALSVALKDIILAIHKMDTSRNDAIGDSTPDSLRSQLQVV